MIDFRYHLVSLVAVFMALAVGIVLGAGPLGQEISSTLEAQVRDLREERNGLRAQLDQAEARDELKSRVLQIVTPTLVSGQLTGRRVALVTLPGADRNVVAQIQDEIAAAGGQVVITARLEDSWADPDTAATRHEVAAELAQDLAEPAPRQGGEPTVESVIAAAVSGRDEIEGSESWRPATDRLDEVGFLETNWADSQDAGTAAPPDSIVIVTGGLDSETVEEDESGDARLQQSLDLVAAFGDVGVPTLLAGYGTEAYSDPVQAAESPVVRGVRAESAIAEAVSTVDNAEGATGQLVAVLALRWAIEGEPGHWGLGTDAVAPAPPMPEPLPEEALPLGPNLPWTDPMTEDEGATEGEGATQGAGEPTLGDGTVTPTDSSPSTGTPTP